MSLEVILSILIEITKYGVDYIIPIAAFIVSLVALKRSSETVKVQVQLSEVEQKLKEYELTLKKYELEKIENEKNKDKKANIEVRPIKISKGKYKFKIYNSGNATAYNVNISIAEEYGIILLNNKLPYEYLEAGEGIDISFFIHDGSSSKFYIDSFWKDEQGNNCSNRELRSV